MPARLISRFLAVAVPLAISAVMVVRYAEPTQPKDWPAVTTVIDQNLLRADPQVFVVGNSGAQAAISAGFARTAKHETVVATLENSTAPTWYAVLRHRVFARGYKPAWVVVAGSTGALTATRPRDTLDSRYLLAIAGTEDRAILDRFTGGSPSADLTFRFLARRSAWRRDIVVNKGFMAAKQVVARIPGARGWEAGSNPMNRGRDRILLNTEMEGLDIPIEDTFVPLLVELARENGSGIAFVRIPTREDVEPTERSDELAAYLWAQGVPYVDELARDFGPEHFFDAYHLNKYGREIFSPRLQRRLFGRQTP